MKLDTTVSLSLLFSIISAIGVIVTIYGVFERQHYKSSERDIETTKNFVKVNMKLDESCRNLSDIAKTMDKTSDILNSVQRHLIDVDNRLENHDKTLAYHGERLDKLEEKLNG
jgi:predicted RNA-binding protein Jag